MFSKGLVGFIFSFVIFVLGFWLMYDLSVQNSLRTEVVMKESRGQIESMDKKINLVKGLFMVEIEKINEANNREDAAKKQAGGGSSVAQVNRLERKVRGLSREVRRLKSIISEYEDI